MQAHVRTQQNMSHGYADLSPEGQRFVQETRPLACSPDPAHYLTSRDGRLVRSRTWKALSPQSETGTAIRRILTDLFHRALELPELNAPSVGSEAYYLRTYMVQLYHQLGRLPDGMWERDQILGPKEAGRPLRTFLMGHRVTQEPGDRGRLQRNWSKVLFAQAVGLGGLRPTGEGANGTQFGRKTGGRLCGIFKPCWKQTPPLKFLGNLLKAWTEGQLSKLPYGERKQPQAEVAAYHLDRFFGFNVVPATMLLEDGSSFQLSLFKHLKHKHGLPSSRNVLALRGDTVNGRLNRRRYLVSELRAWHAYCIHDYLVGNLDGHDQNFFIFCTDNGRVLDVVGIDKAHSFPVKEVTLGSFADADRYRWGRDYRISQAAFTEAARDSMRSCGQRILEAIESLRDLPELDGFFEPAMERRIILRALVLKKAADDPTMSPAKLSQIRSDVQLLVYLNDESAVGAHPMVSTIG